MGEKIIIAVDFGTTYSAIGYAKSKVGVELTRDALHIVDIGWPGQGRRRSPKIPSLFRNSDDQFEYGFEVEDEEDRVAFAKLFLDPHQIDSAAELSRLTNAREVRTVDRLTAGVAQYLKALKAHALLHMVKETRWSQSYVDNTPKDYILCTPAIWSDYAKAKTLQCAYRAGYGNQSSPSSIKTVTEPEAAAVYAITTQPLGSFQVNDIFVVCDAGGGTVDLSTYQINQVHPTLELNEVAISNGDLCGSVFVNKDFLRFVEEKVGVLSPDNRKSVDRDFDENIKPEFTGDDELDYQIDIDDSIPDNPDQGFEGGTLIITSDELRGIFDKTITQVLILLTNQMGTAAGLGCSTAVPILLVGGFGSSNYLRKRIEEQFPESRVVQPPDSWSAVIRGALLRGTLKKRKIRSAYGVVFRKLWTPSLDAMGADFKQEHQVWDRFEQKYRCNNCMCWYVKKGAEFSETKTVSFPFYRTVGIYHSMKFTDTLYVYMEGHDGDEGPSYKDADCQPLLELETDLLHHIPDLKERLERSGKKKTSPEGSYYKVEYDLVMSFDNMIEFHLKYNGKIIGKIDSEYVDPVAQGGHEM